MGSDHTFRMIVIFLEGNNGVSIQIEIQIFTICLEKNVGLFQVKLI